MARYYVVLILTVMFGVMSAANAGSALAMGGAEGNGGRTQFRNGLGQVSHELRFNKLRYIKGKKPKVVDVEIDFFDNDNDNDNGSEAVGTLSAPEADYDMAREVVSGDGLLRYVSEGLSATGMHFHADLRTRVATIADDCRVYHAGLEFDCDQVVLEFNAADESERLRRMTSKGNLTVRNRDCTDCPFDSATAPIAIYETATGDISFSQGIFVVKDGITTHLNRFVYETRDKTPALNSEVTDSEAPPAAGVR